MSATKTPPLLPHWLVMKDFDEELLKKVTDFRMHLTEDDTIPPNTRNS
jgi:hypothetical protein